MTTKTSNQLLCDILLSNTDIYEPFAANPSHPVAKHWGNLDYSGSPSHLAQVAEHAKEQDDIILLLCQIVGDL